MIFPSDHIHTPTGDTSQFRDPEQGPVRVWTLHDEHGYVTHNTFEKVLARVLKEPGRRWRMRTCGTIAAPEPVPLCADCLASCQAGGEPDFAWRRAEDDEPCGAADHEQDDGPDQDGGAA